MKKIKSVRKKFRESAWGQLAEPAFPGRIIASGNGAIQVAGRRVAPKAARPKKVKPKGSAKGAISRGPAKWAKVRLGNKAKIRKTTKASAHSWPAEKYEGPEVGRDPRQRLDHALAAKGKNTSPLRRDEEEALRPLMSRKKIEKLKQEHRAPRRAPELHHALRTKPKNRYTFRSDEEEVLRTFMSPKEIEQFKERSWREYHWQSDFRLAYDRSQFRGRTIALLIENADRMVRDEGGKPLWSAAKVMDWFVCNCGYERYRYPAAFGDVLGRCGVQAPYVVVSDRCYYYLPCCKESPRMKRLWHWKLQGFRPFVLREMIAG